jgi:hypothetical protein
VVSEAKPASATSTKSTTSRMIVEARSQRAAVMPWDDARNFRRARLLLPSPRKCSEVGNATAGCVGLAWASESCRARSSSYENDTSVGKPAELIAGSAP